MERTPESSSQCVECRLSWSLGMCVATSRSCGNGWRDRIIVRCNRIISGSFIICRPVCYRMNTQNQLNASCGLQPIGKSFFHDNESLNTHFLSLNMSFCFCVGSHTGSIFYPAFVSLGVFDLFCQG